VLDIAAQAGSPTGTVRALIAGHTAAEQFFTHFHGRQWDGTTVHARIMEVRPAAPHSTPLTAAPAFRMPPGLSLKAGLGADEVKEVPTDDSTEAASGTSEVDDEVDVLGEEMLAA